ncbi:MAG: Ig-like domain-containing protein, partial [Gemmatimonadaceae bacterium]
MTITGCAPGGWCRLRHPIPWLAAVLALSCGNPTGVDLAPTSEVSAVAVDPAASTVAIGAELPLRAVVMDGTGHAASGASVIWSVRDPGIASVSTTGVVAGRAVGTTQVAASAGGKSGIATITVQPPPVASVVVSPAPLSLALGQVKPLAVVTRDAGGAALAGRSVSWSSANASVAVVSPEGAVTATGIGTTMVTATSEGVSGSTTVTVTPVPVATVLVQPTTVTVTAGQSAALDFVLKDATGTPLDRTDRPVVWSSSDHAVARVSSAGVVTGVAPGQATITATREGVSGSSAVTVVTVPVGSVTLQPSAASLIVGESATLTAATSDAGGGPLANRVVTWTSSDASVATVTSTGVVTAIRPGSAMITAASEGKSGSATISVVRAPVLAVTVEPATLSIPSGQSRPLTITVTDANHVIVSDRDVVWTSSNELAATVSPNGIVTAHALGSATITATSEGKSGSAQVTVTGAAVGSVTVEPASPSVTVGQTTTLTATVTDANGTVVTDRVVTWSSSNNTVATVSATGIVSAIAAGTAVITATTSDGKSGSASVTVTSLPVGSVAIEPTGTTLLPGASTTLTATVRDVAGTVVTDRSVTWTSSNILVASVSTTGVLTAVAPGSATITATAEGKSGTS